MGKKKKATEKGAGSGASTTTKPKKKDPEPEITLGEALVAFQVKVTERSVEEFSEDVDEWQFKNDRLRERNKKMKSEQLEHIKRLLQQAKERDKKLYESTKVVGREEVEAAKTELIHAGKEAEQDIQDLHTAIAECDKELALATAEVNRLKAYQDEGQYVHRKQIELFRQQLAAFDAEYEEQKESLDSQKTASRQAFSCQIEEVIAQQRHVASEVAISELDPKRHMEVHYRKQLRSEVAQLREDVSHLAGEVEVIEQNNLQLVSELWSKEANSLASPRNSRPTFRPPTGCMSQVVDDHADALVEDSTIAEEDETDNGGHSDSLFVNGKAVIVHLSPEKADTPLRLPPLPPCSSLTNGRHCSQDTSLHSAHTSWPVTYDMLKSVVGVPSKK